MKRHTKCRTHVQQEARKVLLEVTRAQRCLARCLARVDEAKVTEAEVCQIRQQSAVVERMIEAFNAAKSELGTLGDHAAGPKADGPRRSAKHPIAFQMHRHPLRSALSDALVRRRIIAFAVGRRWLRANPVIRNSWCGARVSEVLLSNTSNQAAREN